jgi:hypothetical protein
MMEPDQGFEFRCAGCGLPVTRVVVPLCDEWLLNAADGSDYLPEGHFMISRGEYYTGTEGQILLNLKDLRNTKHHHDSRRLNGCCGLDGCDGINRVCTNEHEIGTERSDCWLPHAVHIDPSLVTQHDM